MATRDQNEEHLYGVVVGVLSTWLDKARTVIMRPWRDRRSQPDPLGAYAVAPAWDDGIDTILTSLGKIALDAWSETTNLPPVSRHAFVMSSLAQTRNFLVGIPNEVADLVFAAIIDAVNGGQDAEGVARAVDDVLSWTGSTNWPGRSRNIAVTETTRAYGAGTLAAGMEQSRVSGRLLLKRWDGEHDARMRASHRVVDGTVVGLFSPFYVGGFAMMHPGDSSTMASADEVCGCRCVLTILDERGR